MPRLLTIFFITCFFFPMMPLPAQSTFYMGYESATYPRGFNRIVPTPDQGFALIAGGIESSIVKFDANWNIEWAHELDSVFTLHDLILTNDDHLVVLGNNDNSYTAIYLAKLDLSGNFIFQEKLEYDFSGSYTLTAFNLMSAYDNGFLILGGNCVGENLVIRMDKDGNEVWAKEYPNTTQAGTGTFWEGLKTGNGEYVMVSSNRDVSFYKIDDSGTMQWHTHYTLGTGLNAQVNHIIASPASGFYISGKYYNNSNVQHQVLAAVGAQGNISWAKEISESGNTSMSIVSEMLLSPTNEIMLFGLCSKSNNQSSQYQVSRFSLQGNHLGTNLSGSDFFQYGFDEIRDAVYVGSDLYMAGHSGYDNNVIAKLTADGTGFCNSAAFSPVITDITASAVSMPDNAVSFNLPIRVTALNDAHSTPSYVQEVFCGSVPTAMDVTVEEEWEVWPQPANGDFWLKHPEGAGGTLRILDMAGREVMRENVAPGSGQTRIWAGAIPIGVYFLEAEVGGHHYSQKLILK